jgi:hypothetical protein
MRFYKFDEAPARPYLLLHNSYILLYVEPQTFLTNDLSNTLRAFTTFEVTYQASAL